MSVLGSEVTAPVARGTSRVLGLLLVLPAMALAVWQLVIPAVQTVWASFFAMRLTRPGRGQFLGLEAYRELDVAGAIWHDALVGLVAWFVASAVGLSVGLLESQASRRIRLAVRAVLGATVVLYAPVGIALAVTGI